MVDTTVKEYQPLKQTWQVAWWCHHHVEVCKTQTIHKYFVGISTRQRFRQSVYEELLPLQMNQCVFYESSFKSNHPEVFLGEVA